MEVRITIENASHRIFQILCALVAAPVESRRTRSLQYGFVTDTGTTVLRDDFQVAWLCVSVEKL
jgi:hypothetical protein